MEGFEQVVALQSTVFPPEESYSINQILELCTLETVLYKSFWNRNRFCGLLFFNVGRTRIYLFYLAVCEDQRSKGLGTSLLCWLKERYPDKSIVANISKSVFFESILEEIQIMMRGYNENVNVHFIGETDNEVATAARIVSYMKPKGIIFLGGYLDTFRKEFSQINLPCVLVTIGAENLGFDNLSSFTTDYYDAGRFIVNKLLSYGHTRIGILGGYSTDSSSEHKNGKITGAVEALDEKGIAFDFDREYEPCSYSAESGYEAALRLLRRSPNLTAVLAVSDSIALGAIRALKDIGLCVPEDISVIGFDGLTYSRYSIPRLATIRQDTATLVKKCVDDLLMRITYGGPAVHELIPYEFIEGESVAAVRQ